MGDRNQGFFEKEEKRLNIKRSIVEIAGMCDIQGIDIIPITPEACEAVKALPHIHEDPFDRMIIAQAMLGGMELVTKDENICKYPECGEYGNQYSVDNAAFLH